MLLEVGFHPSLTGVPEVFEGHEGGFKREAGGKEVALGGRRRV